MGFEPMFPRYKSSRFYKIDFELNVTLHNLKNLYTLAATAYCHKPRYLLPCDILFDHHIRYICHEGNQDTWQNYHQHRSMCYLYLLSVNFILLKK